MMRTILLFCLSVLTFSNLFYAQSPELWCTTTGGGNNSGGTIIKLNYETQSYEIEYHMEAAGGIYPMGTLLQASNGLIYGTCLQGGLFESCTLFSYNPITNQYLNEYDFLLEGDFPQCGLIEVPNGRLYGIASDGVIYSFELATGNYQAEYWMDGNFGQPIGKLMQASNGLLYGMTLGFTEPDLGCIYSYNILTDEFVVEHEFTNFEIYSLPDDDGIGGMGSLIESDDQKLLGLCSRGGDDDHGGIFAYDLLTGEFNVLHHFDGADGGQPTGDLMIADNGLCYGLTSKGGEHDLGVIFSFNLENNSYVKLFDFYIESGGYPNGNLVQAADGKLYGATPRFGETLSIDYGGTIFSYEIESGTFLKIIGFPAAMSVPSGPNGGFISLAEPTSVDMKFEEQFSLFPNPAGDKANVFFQSKGESAVVKIYNMHGELVMNEPRISSAQFESLVLDVRHLSPGIYSVELVMDNRRSAIRMIKS